MIIGIPRERKTLEQRVALTPQGAHELTQRGHTLLVETKAGACSYFEDSDYKAAGCEVVKTLAEVWNRAGLVVKVKEPDKEEYQYFRPGLMVFDYLHLAGLPEVAKAMIDGKVTGIAYELVQTTSGRLPLLEPMSEIAGRLAVLNGSYFLLAQNGGRGILLGGSIGVPPAEVVIVGAGIAGRAACGYALGAGARVTILDISHDALERVQATFGNKPITIYSSAAALEQACMAADLVIGAVLVPGAAAPRIITRDLIRKMKKAAVFVDISVDQGGCSETTKPTSLQQPVFDCEGVIHYAVPNMPAQTPRTSTMALTTVTLPYILEIAEKGLVQAASDNPAIRCAINTHKGSMTNRAVAQDLGMPFVELASVM
jgi:alanine dehydrogenase